MKKYIGCKYVEAEPCEAWREMGTHKIGEDGYRIVYPDGYVSWSPKEAFEAAYIETPESVTQSVLRDCTKQIVFGVTVARALETLQNLK